MKYLFFILLIIIVFGFTNSRSKEETKNRALGSIDTIYIHQGSILKVIIKTKEYILEEKEYFLDNEIILDTITLEKTKFIPEGPGALGGKSISYYENGQIKEEIQTKNEFGCWMDSGLFEYFDLKGNLTKTVYYDNWKNEDDGCHSTVHDITQKEFYIEGQLKSEKHYQSAYEEGELNPVGEWKFYNEKGKTIRTKRYKRVYLKKAD